MSTAKHSQLPWENPKGSISVMVDGDGPAHKICDMSWSSGANSISEQKANAAYIVRACNHFERMAEALRTLLTESRLELSSHHIHGKINCIEYIEAQRAAETALRDAGLE